MDRFLPIKPYTLMAKVAFIHDYLVQYGGAERVLQALCELFPRAPIYTLLYDAEATGRVFEGRTIRTSFLQRVPFALRRHRYYPLMMPLAVEQFDFSSFDIVLSVSHSFAKGVITKPHTRHISYCLTPPRFLWDSSHQYIGEFTLPWPLKMFLPPFISYLRVWDANAARRVDEFVAISDFVRERISKYYLRESTVIYPPVSVENFSVSDKPRDYFLMVGRLVAYKRFDLGIRAAKTLRVPLVIVGDGPEEKRLRHIGGSSVRFAGKVSDERLAELYRGARAVIFPQEEDFGIVPLEAMASGRPVIAFRGGGALETVVEGKTGVFFDEQTPEALIVAMERVSVLAIDPEECRKQAEKFDVEVFKTRIGSLINREY